jgi:PPM family protein phosphatase
MVRAEVQLAWKTQAGHRHQVEGLENEDAVFVTHRHPLFDALLMVADGMGGHSRPREASETAVRVAQEFLSDPDRLLNAGSVVQALAAAVQTAHLAVRDLRRVPAQGGVAPAGRPPGSTLSIAALVDGALHVAHVGDGSVVLMRGGQVRVLAGGEDRRAGNRPAQFLGQEGPLEVEQRQVTLKKGDRLLLCTDGLTRCFREAGPEALERVLGRQAVEIQVVANQLTAYSRPYEYDDDTTVALAEVSALVPGTREAGGQARPSRAPGMSAGSETPRLKSFGEVHGADGPEGRAGGQAGARDRGKSAVLPAVLGAVVGAALLAAGFLMGRLSVPHPAPGTPPADQGVGQLATPDDLRHLPPGNLVLVDKLGGRLFALGTRNGQPGEAPLDLIAYQIGKDGGLRLAGRYRLDPVKGELTDPEGRKLPVRLDAATGALRVLRGGRLSIQTRPPGARIFIDGREVGRSPQRLTLPAGIYNVRVEGRTWSDNDRVEIVAGRAKTLILEPQ